MSYKSNTRSIEQTFEPTETGVIMSAATIERPVAARSTGGTRTRQLRPGRGSGRSTRPASRSVSGVVAPQLRRARSRRTQIAGCSPEFRRAVGSATTVSESVAAGWRLTSRGIAVVLITGAVLAAAAITVITATAITVTSDSYHPHGSALSQR